MFTGLIPPKLTTAIFEEDNSANKPLVIFALIFNAPSCARLRTEPVIKLISPFKVISPAAPESVVVGFLLIEARFKPTSVL